MERLPLASPADSVARGIPLTDGLLLQQFAKDGNPQAFAALMDRHGPYLLGVCRRLTRSVQESEDVFQACFLELARKAATIRHSSSVAGWLQVVAARLSRKVQLARTRRLQREVTSAKSEAVAPEDPSWREACRLLEEEIAQLPESLRSPIALCYFEGQSLDEAAQALDVNPRTLKDRLRRGREVLQKRLVRRGVTLAVLGTLLSANSAQAAVTAPLVQSTLHGVAAVAAKAPLAWTVSVGAISLVGSSSSSVGWGTLAVISFVLLSSTTAAAVAWNRWTNPKDIPSGPASVPVSRMRTIQRSFRGRQFDATVFRWSGPNPARYLEREDEGLRFTLPADAGPGEPVGIQLRHVVRGDFQLDVTLQWPQVAPPSQASAAGATIYFFLDSADSDGLWFGRMNDPKEGPVFAIGHRFNRGAKRRDNFVKKIPARPAAALTRLRVERRGRSFHVSGADGLDEELRSLGGFDIGDESLSIVRFAADPAWSTSAAIDVRLIDFTMSAEEFVGYEE